MLEETYLQTLRDLHALTAEHGLPPTMTALATRRGLSPSAMAKHYAVLVDAGLMLHTKRSPRSAVLTPAGRKLASSRRASTRSVEA